MRLFFKKVLRRIKHIKSLIFSSVLYPFYKKKYKYNIMDDITAVEEVVKNKKSIARFGDGEFKWMLNVAQNSFQKADTNLSQKLCEALNSKNENLLIGIPRAFISLSDYNKFAKKEWKYFIYTYGKKCNRFIPKEQQFIDTNITRCYMDYIDKAKTGQRFNNLKKIWDKREVIIIEGSKTRLGVGNDLFDNASSIERIIAPSTNAFERINEIIEIIKNVDKNKLILISLGPTATVLAYELSNLGYQAIDIGHVDVEYEWWKMNADSKVPIKGKFVNEARNIGDLSNQDINDIKYKKSIIYDVS